MSSDRLTPAEASARTLELCRIAPVIPVITVHDAAHARPLAEALVAGGLPVLEVTLRTPAALEAEAAAGRAADLVDQIEDLAVQMVWTRALTALEPFAALASQRAASLQADDAPPEIVD